MIMQRLVPGVVGSILEGQAMCLSQLTRCNNMHIGLSSGTAELLLYLLSIILICQVLQLSPRMQWKNSHWLW